jgi:hypothetical protein
MKFSQWFNEMEQQSAMPDAKQFSYLACVLDLISQKHLEAVVIKQGHNIPSGWNIRAHHMTVKFNPLIQDMETYKQYFGEDVHLVVTGIASDDKCIAVTVKPSIAFPMTGKPHITIAHSSSVSPVYSNNLLSDDKKFSKIETVDLNSVFAAVKRDQVSIWPEKPFPLAIPSQIKQM